MSKKVLSIFIYSLCPFIGCAQVPSTFQSLYSSLNTYINTFDQTINSNWNGSKASVGFAGQLMSANCNVGPTTLQNSQYFNSVLMELSGLQAMGVQAIEVNAAFPCLYAPFYANQTQYQSVLNFYGAVAQAVHSRGLKLIVMSTVMIADNIMAVGNPSPFYATLSWTQYQSARLANAQAALGAMKPDYLVVIEEPDTEALQTGQSQAYTVSGSISTLNMILNGIQTIRGTTKVGAGVGSWTPQYQTFIQAYTGTAVDFIDMHIFEVNKNYLPAAQGIADLAIAAGKGVSISGAWLSKISDSELTTLNGNAMSARDPYSFWAPLDTQFLGMLANFSEWKHALFLAPFFSQYLRANMPYNPVNSALTAVQMNSSELTNEVTNIQQGIYTSTGAAYSHAILPQPDTQAPTEVQGLVGYPATQSVILTWSPSTDNVGVAGYAIFRNGSQIGTTSQTNYQDMGVTGFASNSYAVLAYDVAGNVSLPSTTVSAVPRDTAPPLMSSTPTATALYPTEVQVTWQPAQSALPIACYRVFRGTNPEMLALAGLRLNPQYIDYPVTPGTQYCYAVQAEDNQGNISVQSPTVCTTTPAKF
jgi:hypothetical protein